MIKTCEFASAKHPDKICDLIADSILDAYLKKDDKSRVAIEILGGHKLVTITGEVKSRTKVNIKDIVKRIAGKEYEIKINLEQQSPFISQGVNQGGAGDQGIMIGYACRDTKTFMPYEYELARNLCKDIYKKYPFDGKVQVTIDGKKVIAVIASFQNAKTNQLEKLVRSLIKAENYLINPAGEWLLGGFDADSGLSGRKIVIDAYGPQVPVGGGSFSGKDPTKVDRSGAYMARRIAVDLVQKYKADEVLVKLAYAIGKKEPIMAIVLLNGKETFIPKKYDLSPQGIIKFLKLRRPIYAQTAVWGHFGRGFIWD
ncbi:MAG: methionine adenosyltransferase domain-containing protein [Candidatus Paceibacterota bacterium]|jgi:S-adenosylmethionine synthetase